MKLSNYLVSVLILATCISCSKTDVVSDGLHGEVKDVVSVDFKACNVSEGSGVVVEDILAYGAFYISYDSVGNRIDSVNYKLDNLKAESKAFLSADKMLEETKLYDYDLRPDDHILYHYIFTYDKHGKPTSHINLTDGDTTYYEYTYDSKGKLTKKYDPCIGSYTYTYDKQGKLIKEELYTDIGEEDTTTYEYDENGNNTVSISKSDFGHICRYEYVYDEYKRTIGQTAYSSYGGAYVLSGKVQFGYLHKEDKVHYLLKDFDEKGKLFDESYYLFGCVGNDTLAHITVDNKNISIVNITEINKDGSQVTSTYYPVCKKTNKKVPVSQTTDEKTDANGNVINCSQDGKQVTHEYVYDNKNNWIKRTKYENGKAKMITMRSFAYY